MIDDVTGKVVGGEHQAFIRLLGSLVTTLLPGHYLDFRDVPDQFKDQVINQTKVNNNSCTCFFYYY